MQGLLLRQGCQAAHWAAGHKVECKVAVDRRQLFRIGALVQESFYQSSKAIWFHDVTKIKKIEHAEKDGGPKLLVWRGEGNVDLSAFPHDLIKEKRDERAVMALASSMSAVSFMDPLVGDLVGTAKCRITVEQVAVLPLASKYVRFVPQAESASNSASASSVFRATLRNGHMFAIDPCNAQYNFTTRVEHGHGVFEWNSYMERLLVADKNAGEVRLLDLNQIRFPSTAVFGNLADGQAGNFVDADIKSTAETRLHSILMVFGAVLGARFGSEPMTFQDLTCYTTLAKLTSRSSTDHDHAEEVVAFKKTLQEVLGPRKALSVKEMLMARLSLEPGN